MASEQTASLSRVVGSTDTAAAWGSDFPPAASTPFVLGLSEVACHNAVRDGLGPGEITVGVFAEIKHSAPSPVGAELTAKATLEEQSGRRFKFRVTVLDGEREVATVIHERAVVDRKAIIDRLEAA